jgi:tetratricopeptide (TPR) repeat protein
MTMIDSSIVEVALSRYEAALNSLDKPDIPDLDKPDIPDKAYLEELVLEVLLARQEVQIALENAKTISTTIFIKLKDQDTRLKKHRDKVCQARQHWHEIIDPPKTAWWWHLEPPALFPWLEQPHPLLEQFDWLWKFLTLIALAISITFILNTFQRALSSGLDKTGFWAVAAQTILVLAGGSTLTQQGREALETILASFRIPKYYWQELSTILSIIFLTIVIGIHSLYLPQLATNSYQDGVRQYTSGNIGSAMLAYQQAIALRPDYNEAHYGLGILYERLQQTDKAIQEYQQVIQSDLGNLTLLTQLRTRNNLGRLYILDGKYLDAWIVLEEGLDLIEGTTQASQDILDEEYNLLKNLGWLRLQEKHYVDAESFLQQAIELNSERASAYCLQAQVLEEISQKQESISYWENCIRYAISSNPDDAMRAATAREKLIGREAP